MAVVSERTLRMKQGFMRLYEEGYSKTEIAEHYNLSGKTVYRHLQEIAEENGVKREDLINGIRVNKGERFWSKHASQVKVDFDELNNGFDKAKSIAGNLISMIDTKLNEIEEEKEYAC